MVFFGNYLAALPSLWNNIDRNNLALSDVGKLLVNVIQILLYAAGILAVVFIIIGGIQYIYSAGNSSTVQSAKSTLTYAIGGLVLVFISGAILSFLGSLFK